jgi:hypothetical protein
MHAVVFRRTYVESTDHLPGVVDSKAALEIPPSVARSVTLSPLGPAKKA